MLHEISESELFDAKQPRSDLCVVNNRRQLAELPFQHGHIVIRTVHPDCSIPEVSREGG